MKKAYYYKSYNDDIVQSKKQEYKLKDGYKWIKNNIFYRFLSCIVYFLFFIIGNIYIRICLHVKIENKKILKEYRKNGYFLYGNHTQPIGDVFIPACVCSPKRIYVEVSQANLGIPLLGKILPMLGALPTPDSRADLKKFIEAVKYRINQKKCVVVYPESHEWPYYTKIRPFNSGAFKIQVNENVPAFCITTTYYKRKIGNKPGIKVYVDGPFIVDEKMDRKQKIENLSKEIYNYMTERAKNSNYEYIKYNEEK